MSKQTSLSDFGNQDAAQNVARQKAVGITRIVESVHLGLTVLALLASITILGTAGDALSVYNKTHLSQDFLLPLWPTSFDIRPTVALVTCSAIILISSTIALVVSKVPAIRSKHLISLTLSHLAPICSLIASLIATSFFYGVNSSNTNYSLQAWSCQWSSIEMDIAPHWDVLCRESKAALYLMVMMIPLQVFVLATLAWGVVAEKKSRVGNHERKGSPAMS